MVDEPGFKFPKFPSLDVAVAISRREQSVLAEAAKKFNTLKNANVKSDPPNLTLGGDNVKPLNTEAKLEERGAENTSAAQKTRARRKEERAALERVIENAKTYASDLPYDKYALNEADCLLLRQTFDLVGVPYSGREAQPEIPKLCEDEGCPQFGEPHVCVDLLKVAEKQSEVIGILITIQQILLEEMNDVPPNALGLSEQVISLLGVIKKMVAPLNTPKLEKN